MSAWDHIQVTLGVLGWLVLLHLSPLPLPRFKPFNCVVCSAGWCAIGAYSYFVLSGSCHWSAGILGVGTTALAAMFTVGFAPWLWRSTDPPSS